VAKRRAGGWQVLDMKRVFEMVYSFLQPLAVLLHRGVSHSFMNRFLAMEVGPHLAITWVGTDHFVRKP
jgi:hypothetical protein